MRNTFTNTHTSTHKHTQCAQHIHKHTHIQKYAQCAQHFHKHTYTQTYTHTSHLQRPSLLQQRAHHLPKPGLLLLLLARSQGAVVRGGAICEGQGAVPTVCICVRVYVCMCMCVCVGVGERGIRVTRINNLSTFSCVAYDMAALILRQTMSQSDKGSVDGCLLSANNGHFWTFSQSGPSANMGTVLSLRELGGVHAGTCTYTHTHINTHASTCSLTCIESCSQGSRVAHKDRHTHTHKQGKACACKCMMQHTTHTHTHTLARMHARTNAQENTNTHKRTRRHKHALTHKIT